MLTLQNIWQRDQDIQEQIVKDLTEQKITVEQFLNKIELQKQDFRKKLADLLVIGKVQSKDRFIKGNWVEAF